MAEIVASSLPDEILPKKHIDHLHGDHAFWIFAMAELCTMGMGLWVFAFYKADAPQLSQMLHDALHPKLALINTLLLLTSGALIAAAVKRETQKSDTFGLWLLAFLLGILFLGVKGFEYSSMAQAGFNLSSNTLVSGYFLLTGFHYLHVFLGIFFIANVLLQRWMSAKNSEEDAKTAEEKQNFGASIAVFWHSLDLMWIVIFAVVYS